MSNNFNNVRACVQHVKEVKLLLGSTTETRLTYSEKRMYRQAFLMELESYSRILDATPTSSNQYHEQIGSSLGIKADTVRTNLNRVFKKMEAQLGNQGILFIPIDEETRRPPIVGYGKLIRIANLLHSWRRTELLQGCLSDPDSDLNTVIQKFEKSDLSRLLACIQNMQDGLDSGFR